MRVFRLSALAVVLGALIGLATAPAHAANIIGFADNATSCGGSTLCSTDETTGYTGGEPFDLSTILSWFQIDESGVSHIAGQPAETDGGAGNVLVKNNTGGVVTNFSLTVTDTFTSSTPSVTCGGGVCTDNFQIHGGAANYFTTLTLTGADCVSGCGTDSANFKPDLATYNWSGGTGVPAGATFDLNFASWNNDIFASSGGSLTAPEPASMLLLGAGGLLGLGVMRRRRR